MAQSMPVTHRLGMVLWISWGPVGVPLWTGRGSAVRAEVADPRHLRSGAGRIVFHVLWTRKSLPAAKRQSQRAMAGTGLTPSTGGGR